MRFNAYISSCRALSLWRGVVMNSHVKRDPMGWYGHTSRCGAVINGWWWCNPMLWYGRTSRFGVMVNPMSWTIVALWRGDQWMMIWQPHRGCTFDSPGLPTIGGYPGEQGVRDATPLGVVLSFCVLSNTSNVTIRGIASL